MGVLPREQILVVDDEPQILVALEDLLGDEFLVHKATSAERALDMMQDKSRDIAVVVTDQRMPKMAGDELVSRINENYNAQRIMVTGYADLSAVIRAVNDGRIFAYVTKPWNEEDLRLKVTKAAEQFRLSQELAREKKLLGDLMNNSPDGIYFKDRELRFLRVNQNVADWLNQDVHELVGKRLSELLPPIHDAESIEEQELLSLDDGSGLLDTTRCVEIEGGRRWLSERKAPVRGPKGKVLGLVGISRDITKQRELEEQLVQSQKMEAVGRLAGGVAHDFNNVLAIIQSYASLIRSGLPEDGPSRDDMAELLAATDRAKTLTKQLLTFSRRTPVLAVSVDINEVVASVDKMISRLVDRNIEVRTQLATHLCPLRSDVNQLEQVLLNLAINARDAMPSGGTLTFTTELRSATFENDPEPSEYICISVADTGTGMSPEVQKRIFEPFYSTKDVGKGTGLGLSTVYGIVRQWEGQIRVESQLGFGSCFRIYFPIPPYEIGSRTPLPRVTREQTAGHETILLVEDNEALRAVAARILRLEGYRVLEANSPSSARAVSEERGAEIDLLLSDINMPETTGTELADELTMHFPRLRVLLMSGYSEGKRKVATSTPAGVRLLEKPFSPESLARSVRAALDE